MPRLLYIGPARPKLPSEGWEIVSAAEMRAGASSLGAADVALFDLQGDRGIEAVNALRVRHPSVRRVVLRGIDADFDQELAHLGHLYASRTTSAVRLEWMLLHAIGESGLPEQMSHLAPSQLPVFPTSISRLLFALDDEEIRLESAAAIIANDPGLATQVLAVANSAYYGLPRRVTRVAEAASILGVAALRRTVLAAAVFGVFDKIGDRSIVQRLREYSLLRMKIASDIAGIPDEELATAALLMDVGRLANIADGHEYEFNLFPTPEQLDSESVRFGVDSGLFSAYLLKFWGVPDAITRLVAESSWDDPRPEESRGNAFLLRIASALAAEALGEEAPVSAEWLKAFGVLQKFDGWRESASNLAMQWPAA